MPTVRTNICVPVALYDEVLRCVNEKRKLNTQRALKKIPDGESRSNSRCPLGKAVGYALALKGKSIQTFIRLVDGNSDTPERSVRIIRGARPGRKAA